MTTPVKKSVVIFAGQGGIGSALVRVCCEHGWNVTATYHTTPPTDSNVALATWLPCNITDEKSVNAVYAAAGTIDAVVNAAACPLALKTVMELSVSDFYTELMLYTLGAVITTKGAHAVMPDGGVVVQLLTQAIETYPGRMTSYITAKAGVHGFIKAAAPELARSGVKLIGVSPSFVETSMLDAFPAKLLELQRNTQPNGVFLQPDDVAKVIFSLLKNTTSTHAGDVIALPDRMAAAALTVTNGS